MTNEVFYSAPCLSSELPVITAKSLSKCFKGSDRRYMSQALKKFEVFNQDCLSFLGVKTSITGIDPDVSLRFETRGYIGAIPLRTPSNGKQTGDLLVYPRFAGGISLYEQLTKILIMMGESIRPEFMDSIPLKSGTVVRPPLYYDAVKCIDLFEKAERQNWKKFKTQQKDYSFPKSSTNWNKYIMREFNPAYRLIYPACESILSCNHDEWRGLKYVFEIAKAEVFKATTPSSIRYKILPKMEALTQKTGHIVPLQTKQFLVHVSDPLSIKELKIQANVFMQQNSDEISAWRIDVSQLFEKYVQYILNQIIREMPARLTTNSRFTASGRLPSWGLRYLEPDVLIHNDNQQIAVDVKYKPHFYNRGQVSETLKDTHRMDLHQILAYCAFADNKDKTGMLFYPAAKCGFEKIIYNNSFNNVKNSIYIVGIPFSANILPETQEILYRILSETLLYS